MQVNLTLSPPLKEDLLNRVWIISKALDHYEVAAETNLEQLQNLLSLVREPPSTFTIDENANPLVGLNIETVVQGQNVARLNLFAFVFLPLSFVAVRPLWVWGTIILADTSNSPFSESQP